MKDLVFLMTCFSSLLVNSRGISHIAFVCAEKYQKKNSLEIKALSGVCIKHTHSKELCF